MFNLRDFVKGGLISAIGKMEDYQVILNAAGWHEKGVLTEDDLKEIQSRIEAQYLVEEEQLEVEIRNEEDCCENPNSATHEGEIQNDVI